MKLNPFGIFNTYDLSKASEEFTQGILKDYNNNRPKGPQKLVCMAPFKSIYFGHYGKAVACCYNRTYVLGNYPNETIKEIWFGEQADNLRKYISENNLDHGCHGCKSQILAGNYDATKAKQYDERLLNGNRYPSVMEFELSNTCNLECEMCSGDFSSLIRQNRENRPPLQEPYDDSFVEQLDEFIPHLEEVKFYGGEPFLIEIYYKIWERIIRLNPSVRISIQTNGTILNNRVKRIMEQSEFHMNISIDSLEKDNYERIRKNAKFERTMENMEWFRNYCKERNTFFGISACAMQQNWHELPSFVRHCNKLEIPVYFHTVFFPKECGFHAVDKNKLQQMVDALSAEEISADTEIEKKNKRHFEDTIKQLKHLIGEKRREENSTVVLEEMEDLKIFVQKVIDENTKWSGAEKAEKKKKILAKLSELENKLGPDFDFKELFARFDFENKVVVNNLVHQVETWPASALALLAKTAS